MMASRWSRSQRQAAFLCMIAALCVLYYVCLDYSMQSDLNLDLSRRRAVKLVPELPNEVLEPSLSMDSSIQKKMQEAVKLDKGTGCEIPYLNPFDKEATQFDRKLPPLKCPKEPDWVTCYHSKCVVLERNASVVCSFQDIMYHGDSNYTLGAIRNVTGGGVYYLTASDYAKVTCFTYNKPPQNWTGIVLGFRRVRQPPSPPSREHSFNVLILAFDSASKTGFIRHMPKSWKVLNEELEATIMEGFNIVGDGTSGALFPLLTGSTELELPDVRKRSRNKTTMDDLPFIFYKLKRDGYRTAYFEDMPSFGTFQFRYKGFRFQPADHYNRAYIAATPRKQWKGWTFCLGNTPQYKVMLNITEQFLELDGKRFIFTIIADITHEDFNKIQWADDDTADFLMRLLQRTEDTLIVVMGDHGPRYSKIRRSNSFRGKLDERLPLLAIRLPSRLIRHWPDALSALKANSRALTTPHDLHATILDVLDMREYWNSYKMPGADLKRGLTMLEPIPRNRSCSEAGIEPHWCTCLVWQTVDSSDPVYEKSAQAVVNYINGLVKEIRSKCIPRTLSSINWVLRQRVNKRLLSYAKSDSASYVGNFSYNTKMNNENYQVKIVTNPGRSSYEASLSYSVQKDEFTIHSTDISRTNLYRGESDCIIDSYPHLAAYCYCYR